MLQIKDIVIIGSGNVATNLAKAFHEKGRKIKYVYSNTLENAKILADMFGSGYTNNIEELPSSAHLYVIAVNDSKITEIIAKLSHVKGIVVHTSGSVPISAFENYNFVGYGVFYPLMTFSKSKTIKFTDVPICIEAGSISAYVPLYKLGDAISRNVKQIPSEKRKFLHLAAVFACNFANLNYTIAQELLERNQLSMDLLHPLITETARKILYGKPSENQTGPAVREDGHILQQHLQLLDELPEIRELYELSSKLILSFKYKT